MRQPLRHPLRDRSRHRSRHPRRACGRAGALAGSIQAAALALVLLFVPLAAVGPTLAAVGPAPAAAQEVPSDGARSFGDDVELGARLVGHGLTAPARWSLAQWLTIPGALGVLAVVSTVDDDLAAYAQSNRGPVGDAWFGALEPFGQEYSIPLVIAMYLGGAAFDGPALQRTAVEAAAASVVAGGIVTPTLKLAFGRARPRQDLGAYAFDPFGGDKSFPSGHTTQAFALASVFAAESESWVVDVLAYGIAASVGGARIYHDAHFLTDVLAAAAIGTVVGRTVVRRGHELTGSSAPFVGGGSAGVSLGVRIPLR